MNSKTLNRWFITIIPLCLLVFFLFDFLPLSYTEKSIVLALSTGIYLLMRKADLATFLSKRTKTSTFFFILIVLYAGFASAGHPLFFIEYPVPRAALKIVYLLLFCCWLSFVAIAFLYFTEACKRRLFEKSAAQTHTTLKLYLVFGGILLACWLVYYIGFFPGTISPDSLEQWKQAHGLHPLNDAHPVFYTLVIRALSTIWDSPAIISLSQLLFMAGVCASFLVFLYKTGVPYKWLLIFAIITGIMPTNGIMTITLWKDIPFCTAMVWLTLVLAELLTQTYIFNKKTTLVFLAISLVAVSFLRHNGVLTGFCTVAVLIAFAIRHKRKELLLPVAGFLLMFFVYKKLVLPVWLKVPPVPTAYQLMAPVHGIASVIHYGRPLPPATMQEMQKIEPVEVWKTRYNPYSADEYLEIAGGSDSSFINKLSKVPTSKVLGMYTNTFLQYPFLIAKDRLCGSELMWNAFQAPGSPNYSYEPNIEENEFGFKHSENGLKKALMGILGFAGRAADPVTRRPGIFNILILLVLLYVARRNNNYWIIFLPLIAANGSLLLSMTYQSLRYVYYIPLLFGFLWLFAVSKPVTPVVK